MEQIRQLVILSGKGGTGKTSVAAALAHLAAAGNQTVRAVLADADVDAANLELVLAPSRLETHDFIGGGVAILDPVLCEGCGLCIEVCRFDAISRPDTQVETPAIDPIACDGCAACVYQCPTGAIHMQPQIAGQWFRSDSRYGPLFHAALRPAQENSGKLVTMIKQQARLLTFDEGYELIIVDGPPGIGCPVISAASGADLALIVAEPTVAGTHDMERVLQVTQHFGVPALVCVNKADLYPPGTAQIEAHCQTHGIEVIGHIPFDVNVTEAMVRGEPVTAYRPDAPASQAIVDIWQHLVAHLNWASS
ncbi:MAG: ATP-binding protein [Anaerolineae bacterium]